MIKAFYPHTTPKIIHKGRGGNVYRLDGIEKCVALFDALNDEKQVESISVLAKDGVDSAIELINDVHSPILLDSYKTEKPSTVVDSSGFMWQPNLFDYAIEQTEVSKLAVKAADESNGAFAITGGGHHAEKDTPYGFCLVNTMAIAALQARELGHRVAVLDLDSHYSNGCMDILRGERNINVYSLWNQTLGKWKNFESDENIWHHKVEGVDDYFKKLKELLEDIRGFKPTFVVYHLGLDVLEADRMGGVVGMTTEKLLEREAIVQNLILNSLRAKFTVFIGGSYIDRSQAEEVIEEQKKEATRIQLLTLKAYY